MFDSEEEAHPRKTGFGWRVSKPSRYMVKDFALIITVIHSLGKHGLRGLLAD
jgi:hypothetical protein